MKQITKFFLIVFAVMISSCVKEDHVNYRFEVYNATEMPMTVHLTSWGKYMMYINGMYNSNYTFHEMETINSHSSLTFSADVGGDPNPYKILASLTPAWEYIKSIDFDNISIPIEYFANQENWELSSGTQINGTFTSITLVITPDLINELSQN